MEKTLVILKPDIIKRRLIGKILSVYEDNGLVIEKMYSCNADKEILDRHYEEHLERDFYPKLVQYMTSDRIVAIVAGADAVQVVRFINGATNPEKADPNTIRYLYGVNVTENSVHGSASLKEAEKEILVWFPDEDMGEQ